MVELSPRRGASIPAHRRSARAAATHLLHALDDVTRAHEAAVLQSDDPGALHDLRIDLRRARSVLRAFRGVLPAARVRPLHDGMRWLGGLTSGVRDLDVLAERLDAGRASLPKSERQALDPLFELLWRDRAAAREALLAGLRSGRHGSLVAAWRRLVTEASPPRGDAAADPPIREVAAAAVDRAWRRLERRGGAITEASSAPDLHRVRIDGKKLRYLLEELQPFYPEVALEPAIARLRKLQDCLGELHDACVEQETLRSLAERAGALDGAPTAPLMLAAGRVIERATASAALERARFPKKFERVMRGESRRCVAALVDAS